MNIGILALQGAFLEHGIMLNKLGVTLTEVRKLQDITAIDGLIIPGGESTVMVKLLTELGLKEPLKKMIQNGLPVFGTCAGAIVLSKEIADDSMEPLAVMDIAVKRNAYGRQLGSFNTTSSFADQDEIPMTFIRAPYIERILNNDVEILSKVQGKVTAARQKNMLAVCFHPELTDSTAVHEYFLKMI